MRFTISERVLGSNRPISYDIESSRFVQDIGSDDWRFEGKTGGKLRRSVDDLLACNLKTVDTNPPDAHARAMVLACPEIVEAGRAMWLPAIPGAVYREWVAGVVRAIADAIAELETGYYLGPFADSSRAILGLGGIRVDRDKWEEHLHTGPGGGINPVVASFEPYRDGTLDPVTYDRFGTRTGRLTVKRGPQILTLAKKHRDMLVSRFDGGELRLLDFVSFEAQIARVVTGKSVLPDVYDDVVHKVFGGEMERKRAKVASLVTLFGGGINAVKKATNLTGKPLNAAAEGLKKYFGIYDIQAQQCSDAKTFGWIRNHYRRRIESDPHRAVNSFIQSTAVDAALLGFGNAMKLFGDDIVPLSVIHDALLIDCSPDGLKKMDEVLDAASMIPGIDAKFPCVSKPIAC